MAARHRRFRHVDTPARKEAPGSCECNNRPNRLFSPSLKKMRRSLFVRGFVFGKADIPVDAEDALFGFQEAMPLSNEPISWIQAGHESHKIIPWLFIAQPVFSIQDRSLFSWVLWGTEWGRLIMSLLFSIDEKGEPFGSPWYNAWVWSGLHLMRPVFTTLDAV